MHTMNFRWHSGSKDSYHRFLSKLFLYSGMAPLIYML